MKPGSNKLLSAKLVTMTQNALPNLKKRHAAITITETFLPKADFDAQ